MTQIGPSRLRTFGLCATVVLASAAPAGAQSAADVIDRMLDGYEARTERIDDYTLVQDVMGIRTVSYFVKELRDGRPVFRMQQSDASGMDTEEGPGTLDEIYALGAEFRENARYLGRETVAGRDVHALELTDLAGTDLAKDFGQDAQFQPQRGSLYLDAETYIPRRMIVEGDLTNSEGVHTVTSTMDLEDYQEHEGLLVAHRTVVTVEGLGAAIDEEARAQFEQMERELESMPPEQRRMVESMMADQLEQFRAMMAGEGDAMVVEVQVQEVRVNAGPPGAP